MPAGCRRSWRWPGPGPARWHTGPPAGAPILTDAAWSPPGHAARLPGQVVSHARRPAVRPRGSGHDPLGGRCRPLRPFGFVVASAMPRPRSSACSSCSGGREGRRRSWPAGRLSARRSPRSTDRRPAPLVTLRGRRGSAMASAAVNAVASPPVTAWLSVVGLGEDGLEGLSPAPAWSKPPRYWSAASAIWRCSRRRRRGRRLLARPRRHPGNQAATGLRAGDRRPAGYGIGRPLAHLPPEDGPPAPSAFSGLRAAWLALRRSDRDPARPAAGALQPFAQPGPTAVGGRCHAGRSPPVARARLRPSEMTVLEHWAGRGACGAPPRAGRRPSPTSTPSP